MSDRTWRLSGTGLLCALALASFGACAAEGDQLLATVTRPAVLTVTPRVESREHPARLTISVTRYRPASDGSVVQGVVKAQRSGSDKEQEIDRFGIFPDAEYKAADPSQAQRFGFNLAQELVSGGPVKVKIELVPVRGTGKGAELEIGSAEIK